MLCRVLVVSLLVPHVEKGDIVTVMEDGNSNRGTWKLRKTMDLHPANYGFVCGATVEVASKTVKCKRLKETRTETVSFGSSGRTCRPVVFSPES